MSANPRGYYRTLGVPVRASPEQIKQAFRSLAKALHPDLNRGQDTTRAFQAVNEGYGVLSVPAQRATYDRTGSPQAVARTSTRGQTSSASPSYKVGLASASTMGATYRYDGD